MIDVIFEPHLKRYYLEIAKVFPPTMCRMSASFLNITVTLYTFNLSTMK